MPNHVRRIGAIVLASALGFGLAACSAGSDSASGPVSLSVLTGFTGSDRPAYENLVAEFNKTHPKIKVTMDIQPWDAIAQKLPSAWATGQAPDIATPSYDPNAIFQYTKTNSALDLGAAGVDSSAFPKSVADAFTYKGKTYAVPANMADMSLFYNKKLLTDAGITAPPATTYDLVADVKKLTKADGSQFGLALPDHGFTLAWSTLQWSNGGDILDSKGCSVLGSTENKQTFSTWGDLVSKDKVSPAGLDAPAAENLFSTGKAAMVVGGPWLVDTFKKAGVDYGVTTMPVGSAGPVTAISTVPFMISKATKHPKEAAEFLTWWTSKTAQTQFVKDSGFPPVRTDMSAASGNEMLKPFTDGLANGKLVMPAQPKAAQITSDAYEPLLGKIMRGENVDTAVSQATAQINSITGCTQ